MDFVLAIIGVAAVLVVLSAALYVRWLVGCLVTIGMVSVGAVMLLLAIFAGPLGLYDDIETVDRLRSKFGLDQHEVDTRPDPPEALSPPPPGDAITAPGNQADHE